jgi:hypothetical protein
LPKYEKIRRQRKGEKKKGNLNGIGNNRDANMRGEEGR